MVIMDDIFNDIDIHILYDEVPSKFLNKIYNNGLFRKEPFDLLYRLKETPQSPRYHPEGNVWNHTMMVVDEAAKRREKSKNQRVFMWAALLHDIGKPTTTRRKKERLVSYDHDKEGARLAKEFLKNFTQNTEFINNVSSLVRWHMQILFVVKDMSFSDISKMKKEVDIEEVALLGLCDRLGRGGAIRSEEEENIRIFIEKCRKSL